jgi:hypothetical protein
MLCGGTISAIVVATGYVLKELELSLPHFFLFSSYPTGLLAPVRVSECSGPYYYNDPHPDNIPLRWNRVRKRTHVHLGIPRRPGNRTEQTWLTDTLPRVIHFSSTEKIATKSKCILHLGRRDSKLAGQLPWKDFA